MPNPPVLRAQHCNPIRGCRYKALRIKQQCHGDKSATHALENSAPAAQGNASSSAAPGHPNPRHLHSQQAETQGKGSRCCRNLPTLRFKPHPSICLIALCLVPGPVCHHAGEASLGSHTNVKGDQKYQQHPLQKHQK